MVEMGLFIIGYIRRAVLPTLANIEFAKAMDLLLFNYL